MSAPANTAAPFLIPERIGTAPCRPFIGGYLSHRVTTGKLASGNRTRELLAVRRAGGRGDQMVRPESEGCSCESDKCLPYTRAQRRCSAPAFFAVKGVLHQPNAKPILRPETRDAIRLAIAKAANPQIRD
jgi:hypothetical protein